jgi:hypothetical protein
MRVLGDGSELTLHQSVVVPYFVQKGILPHKRCFGRKDSFIETFDVASVTSLGSLVSGEELGVAIDTACSTANYGGGFFRVRIAN